MISGYGFVLPTNVSTAELAPPKLRLLRLLSHPTPGPVAKAVSA